MTISHKWLIKNGKGYKPITKYFWTNVFTVKYIMDSVRYTTEVCEYIENWIRTRILGEFQFGSRSLIFENRCSDSWDMDDVWFGIQDRNLRKVIFGVWIWGMQSKVRFGFKSLKTLFAFVLVSGIPDSIWIRNVQSGVFHSKH